MFTTYEIEVFLERELNRDDMQCFTAIRMAKTHLQKQNFDSVIGYLKLDSDKWDEELKVFVRKFQPKFEGGEMVGYERIE